MQLSSIPVVGSLKLFWDRVTFSRLTTIYFAFSVLHCIVQLVFQAQAFVANADAATFLNGLIVQGNATDPGFAVYDDGDLRMCDTVPNTLDASSCTVVWDGQAAASASTSVAAAAAKGDGSGYVVESVSPVTSVATFIPVISVASSSTSIGSLPSATSSTSRVSGTITAAPSSSTALSTVTVTATATLNPKVNIADDSDSEDEDEEDIEVEGESSDSESDEEEGDESDSDSEDEEDQVVTFNPNKRDIVLPETQMRLALNGNATVNLQGVNGKFETELSRKCLYTLNWPVDLVENTKREDIVFIAFQVWLLGMSLVALLNESIPHIIASLLTHVLATAWGAFQIFNTEVFHKKFTTLTTKGACGVNLLPNYWSSRSNAEIPSLALNCFALLVSAFLSWRLIKTFGWQTFKRVGASRTINRVYNLVLMLSIVIQLSLFFIGASAALWVDQVYNGNIGRLTQEPKVFKAVMITVLVLLIPWLSLGWISVRKEFKKRMIAFLFVAVLILVGWATMFIAATFRWTYSTWLFFRLMTTAALLLTVTVLILGLVCRVNFGKGLPRYLQAQEELFDSPTPYPYTEKSYDSEKFAFPSNDDRVPTFSVTFGSGQEVPPPSQMRFTPRSMGPRFASGTTMSSDGVAPRFISGTGTTVSTDSNPFITPTETSPSSVRSYSPPLSRGTMSSQSQAPLTRQTSRSSQMSATSTNSAGSTGSKNGRRWVIE